MFNLRNLIFVTAALAAGIGMQAADNKPAIKPPGGAADLQKLISQFSSRRDALLADRQQLLNQLRSATAEQRKSILEKMQQQEKDLVEAQRALGKQIRDEMRKLRQIPPGGRH